GRVTRQNRIEHCIGNLVGHLVGMAFGHRFGGKDVTPGRGHVEFGSPSGTRGSKTVGRTAAAPEPPVHPTRAQLPRCPPCVSYLRFPGGKVATRPRPGNAEWGSSRRTSMCSPT